MKRFLNRVWKLVNKPISEVKEVHRLRHKTIKKLTELMSNFRFNVGIATLMEYVNGLSRHNAEDQRRKSSGEKWGADKESLRVLILLLAPFAPYTSEELWLKLKAEDPRFGKPIPGEKWSVHQQA